VQRHDAGRQTAQRRQQIERAETAGVDGGDGPLERRGARRERRGDLVGDRLDAVVGHGDPEDVGQRDGVGQGQARRSGRRVEMGGRRGDHRGHGDAGLPEGRDERQAQTAWSDHTYAQRFAW
jgi:hypothetical protein